MKSESFFISKPFVYLITDGEMDDENFAEKSARTLQIIKTAVENNISLIQIREKKLSAKLVFELTRKAVEIAKNSNTKILVNDRADIALAANADGVHLTAESISAKVTRKSFPPDFIIGVSTHKLAEVRTAKDQNADFVTFSPIFQTASKTKYGAPQGLEKLREICENSEPFPVIALGGIDETNYKDVLENGASGFAAISFLNNQENLQKISKELLK